MMMADNHHTLTDRHHRGGQGSDKMAVGDLVDLDENGEQTPSLIVVAPVTERVAPSAGAWTVAERMSTAIPMAVRSGLSGSCW
jgi:hypothetical protein